MSPCRMCVCFRKEHFRRYSNTISCISSNFKNKSKSQMIPPLPPPPQRDESPNSQSPFLKFATFTVEKYTYRVGKVWSFAYQNPYKLYKMVCLHQWKSNKNKRLRDSQTRATGFIVYMACYKTFLLSDDISFDFGMKRKKTVYLLQEEKKMKEEMF